MISETNFLRLVSRKKMSCGWVRVNLPEVLSRTGRWHIQVGQFEGYPCEPIAVPTGVYQVIIRAALDSKSTKLRLQLVVEAFVINGNVTDIRLPLPEQTTQELLKFLQC